MANKRAEALRHSPAQTAAPSTPALPRTHPRRRRRPPGGWRSTPRPALPRPALPRQGKPLLRAQPGSGLGPAWGLRAPALPGNLVTCRRAPPRAGRQPISGRQRRAPASCARGGLRVVGAVEGSRHRCWRVCLAKFLAGSPSFPSRTLVGEGGDPRVGAPVHDDPREPDEVVSSAISPIASTCWPQRGRSTEAVTATQTTNQTQTDSLSPSPNPVSPVPLNNPTSAPRYGTVIPNRIFVGGIDFKTNENDLRKFFSQYGSVKEVKIVNDRAGVSKGYGFITFETQEDAQKILQEAEKLNYKDKKLNIGPAIRKQQVGIPRMY
ncbi:alpha-protein kinase 3-like [Phodopus roborovskii]|uniref:alpha-protein kinase 3-like n=1 Tax=Phodopus roborovskii TaxID=109678 RepID=UPI0021E45879|nr:alpha-protein kinase 3-like [Phodopus roborovskii]